MHPFTNSRLKGVSLQSSPDMVPLQCCKSELDCSDSSMFFSHLLATSPPFPSLPSLESRSGRGCQSSSNRAEGEASTTKIPRKCPAMPGESITSTPLASATRSSESKASSPGLRVSSGARFGRHGVQRRRVEGHWDQLMVCFHFGMVVHSRQRR